MFAAWVEHIWDDGQCSRCGVPIVQGANVGGRAYHHDAVGWLGHYPPGLVVACGGIDGSGQGHATMEPQH